ncbi:hypothetical protein CI610_02337 [invertebrate metagenome]|uniref:Aminoglycoside phosphotransferase domain-containing protein n=1 Tax=invertebrate metagenome TaxID=1711999 RepID=A0A2H9T666_9ZZZZ
MTTGYAPAVQKKTLSSRQAKLARWVQAQFSYQDSADEATLNPVSSDASARRYYRIISSESAHYSVQDLYNESATATAFQKEQADKIRLIVVDAPPATEDSQMFVHIAQQWSSAGIRVPAVYASNYPDGFLLLEDLGDCLLQEALDTCTANTLYQHAFSIINHIQKQPANGLPRYDPRFIHQELSLYPHWFLGQLLDISLTKEEAAQLNDLFAQVTEAMIQQPQVTIHRDFHSRNLMICPQGEIGVIDFQGAMTGPLLYDPVSLLKDCYIQWPEHQIQQWLKQYASLLPLTPSLDFSDIQHWFDLTGLQRHLKCLGIFSRLWLRDGKTEYLKDIPNTLNYILATCDRYDSLHFYSQWLKARALPALESVLGTKQGNIGD